MSAKDFLSFAVGFSLRRRGYSPRTNFAAVAGVAPAIASADSGLKPSGAGKGWSKWYRLGVRKAPSGYTVQKTEFWLSGDHVCGASAECREIARDDQQVLWEFRLQGHHETGSSGRTYSEGHIRVLYRAQ